ncbi:MAG: outer membrane protein [Hyphomicrobium sp.]
MRRMLSSLALALALSAGMIAPASAGGDWGYGSGINPYNVATPVPAPLPVPVYEPQWYFRIDFGAGVGADPSVSSSGVPFDVGGLALTPFGFDSSWLSENFDAFFTGGAGVGYIWGPHFRTDFTFDVRSNGEVDYKGDVIYTTTGNDRFLEVSDKTKVHSVPLLINGYYDFLTSHALRPYVGGGVGFAVNQLRRKHRSTDYDCGGAAQCAPTGGITTTASDETTQVSFAAAAMAGITYNWSSYTAIDLNYRYMYIGGADGDLTINGVKTTVKVGDINEHQVRVGLRFNIH